MLSISEKHFETKFINSKNLSFDENNEYLKALANDTISEYVKENKIKIDKILNEKKEQDKIDNKKTKKKTLKEKIAELKEKRKKTLSLKEKILEQRKQK